MPKSQPVREVPPSTGSVTARRDEAARLISKYHRLALLFRALALKEISPGDGWRRARREAPSGIVRASIAGLIGIICISTRQMAGFLIAALHRPLIAFTMGMAPVGIVTFGSPGGSMLPFALKRFGFDPATALAPFGAALVDVTGPVICFPVA